ncbi:FtsX-like permease family protein [Paenibacillus shunpengii]|uniref:FtsX-like permease family protein n=1 Tax=Paenibacillus shunpengii TaxID=2054424 RepID=A0ABW5STM6_9BACL|nr:ABC transporter permease [Paenibacillus sp. PDC88]SDX09264.1 putative ABC transport system permease protein [Paenibacillus sp. PDC88]
MKGMPLLRLLARKMWNTRWLTLSTLLGLIVAVGFTVSIPMYADGALKRVVAQSLEEESSGMPAGSLLMSYQAAGGTKTDLASLNEVDRYIREDVSSSIGFDHNTYLNVRTIRSTEVSPEDPTKVDASRIRTMTAGSMTDLEDHVTVTQGVMPGNQVRDNVIEAAMLEEGMYRNDLHVGDILEYPVYSGLDLTLRVKITGVFTPDDLTDPYWFQGFEGMMNGLYIDPEVMNTYLLSEKGVPLQTSRWYYAFDLGEIQTSQLPGLGRTLERLDIELYQRLKDTKVDISFGDLLANFRAQSLQLQTMLFTLAVPMIAMVFYFIVMNARQSLQKQESDIAVLRSRGASARQIILLYLLEGLILGAAAMMAGPFLGWFMAKSIGSASGFLEFVDRKAIPVGVTQDALWLGLVAVIASMIASVIPAINYARATIVDAKRRQARSDRKPIWQRWYLDILLLGISGYGYYLFYERQMLTFQTGMTTDQLQVQPFLFFVPAIAIFAMGLFFLRLFPLILKLIQWIGRKIFPVPLYLTLTQLSRSSSSYYPLMILLVLTLGLGVYNASAARTIDLNSTERTLYEYGTDVVMQTVWEGSPELTPVNGGNSGGGGNPNEPGGSSGGGGNNNGGNTGGNPGVSPGGGGNSGGGGNPGPGGGGAAPGRMIYSEPPFEVFRQLPGVEHAARVLQTKGNVIVSGKSAGQGMIVGIDNVDFAEVAWFRNDLFPAHPNRYLDLLGHYEGAVIIPSNLAEKYQLESGDIVSIALQEQMIEFVVFGILPYWPAQYPDQTPFFIANLDYIYDQVPMIPYEVWLKMEPDALVAPLMTELADAGIELSSVKDVRTELVAESKHPSRGGVFGILSLGFLVSIIISLIGYVLYWFFNLSGRVVQFGVLRAMGLSRGQLSGMLLLEQVFTAGLSIALGIGIGQLASRLFLPFLQTTDNVETQVPPFRIVFEASDTNQLYIVTGVMLFIGAVMLLWQIRRLRVHQAVKMGEER